LLIINLFIYLFIYSKSSFDRRQAEIDALRRDAATYCNAPSDQINFEVFCEKFTLSDKTQEISNLLAECQEMRALHSKLGLKL